MMKQLNVSLLLHTCTDIPTLESLISRDSLNLVPPWLAPGGKLWILHALDCKK